VREGSILATPRTQSSIAVRGELNQWVLFNASPDLLTQLKGMPEIQPGRGIRDTGIQSVVLIDSQIDHTTGLFMLRESRVPLEIYCTDPVYNDLTTGNPVFKVLEHYCGVNRHPIRFDGGKFDFSVPGIEDLRFTAYPLKSKAPPYSPHRHDSHIGDTIGVVIEDLKTNRKLFYAPGLGEIESHLPPLMKDSDCLLVDGTFWTEDEMITLKASKKRAQDMGHLAQTGKGGMLEVLDGFSKPRKILIHINNTNPILNEESGERAALRSHGVEVSFDGMEIDL
jgi:pyrroloquinoline quinone biosynthesis protein B